MSTALLCLLALGVVSLGVGMTLLIAVRVPVATLARAQAHGRFAGLGSADRDDGAGRAVRADRRHGLTAGVLAHA